MDKVIEFLIENDFYIKVTMMKEIEGFNIEFPKNVFDTKAPLKDAVAITNNGIQIYGSIEKEYVLPIHARRPAAQYAIFGACSRRELPYQLIKVFDRKDKPIAIDNSVFILNVQLTEEEVELEKQLMLDVRRFLKREIDIISEPDLINILRGN
jgi:hypothetical protein